MNSQKMAGPSSYPFIRHEAPAWVSRPLSGALAQLGERLICIQEVIGSIPIGSTSGDLGLRQPQACAFGTCLKKVHRTFLPGVARAACGSVAQVVRAHA